MWHMSIRETHDPELRSYAVKREIEKLNRSVIEPPKKTKPIPPIKHGMQYCDFMIQKAKFRAVFTNNVLTQVSKEGNVIKDGSIFEYAKLLFKGE